MDLKQKEHYFKEIYKVEADRVFRFASMRVSSREDVVDIVQEVFYKFWQMVESEKKIEYPRSLLFTMARNKIIDWYRKKKSISLTSIENDFLEEGEELQIVDPDSLKDIVVSVEAKEVLRNLSKLPPQYSEAIRLRFVEDLSPREIAETLNISANAFSLRINHALERLREVMNVNKNNE